MSINPATWPLAGKIGGIVAVFAVAAGSGAAILAAGSGTEPGVSSYLCPFSGEKELLQWKASDGQITGTYQDAQLTGTAPDEQVSAGSGYLTGTIRGSGITLNLNEASVWYGTITSSTVVLDVPQPDGTIQAVMCARSDVPAWNAAVQSLDDQASTDNNAANEQAAEQQEEEQHQQEEQQAQAAVNTLTSFSLTGDLGQLSNDVQKVAADLAAETTDAAQGATGPGNPACYNVQSNVSYDAENNVEYDAANTFGYDLQYDLQQDISDGRSEISAVQSDLAKLEAASIAIPTGAQNAISAAQAAINNAISSANSDIAKVNSDVNSAYSIANNLATGNCQGDGPGTPPSPIQDLS